MNLAPRWSAVLREAGHLADHWTDLGPLDAPDEEIMGHALRHGAVVISHDLDFGAILAVTGANGPSVILIRDQEPSPERCAPMLLAAVQRFEAELAQGALVAIDPTTTRARMLPLRDPGEGG